MELPRAMTTGRKNSKLRVTPTSPDTLLRSSRRLRNAPGRHETISLRPDPSVAARPPPGAPAGAHVSWGVASALGARNRRARAVADRAASLEPARRRPGIALSQQEPAWRPRDGAMAPPQRRRATSPRRAGRRAGRHVRPPGWRERAGRSHPLGPPRNPPQAARACCGVPLLGRHRPERHILPAPSYAGRCFPTVCARCQSVVGRVVRRAIRNVARRTPPGASARLRPATSGSMCWARPHGD